MGQRMDKGKVLVTGSQGFIGSYICQDLLEQGYEVYGIDNFSKYGQVSRAHDKHPRFHFHNTDARYMDLEYQNWKTHGNPFSNTQEYKFWDKVRDCDFIIAGAAKIGGISYFHRFAYDLIAENERILASTFDLALKLFKTRNLKRILVLSSSMVFESTQKYPTPEGEQLTCPPPLSTYGFQKLSSEYFCKGAWEQYKLPYTIVRPFNCCGIGEEKALGADEMTVGNQTLMLSHVLPDLVAKALHLKPTDKLPILGDGKQVRHYTNGKDIARGIRLAMESDKAVNNDFNISHPQPMTVLELAEIVWKKVHGTPLQVQHEKPFEYDVQVRSPSVEKAKEVLGFEAEISVEQSVDEVIEYMRKK